MHLDLAGLGDQKVAQLVKKDQSPDKDDEIKEVMNEIHVLTMMYPGEQVQS